MTIFGIVGQGENYRVDRVIMIVSVLSVFSVRRRISRYGKVVCLATSSREDDFSIQRLLRMLTHTVNTVHNAA